MFWFIVFPAVPNVDLNIIQMFIIFLKKMALYEENGPTKPWKVKLAASSTIHLGIPYSKWYY